ncbi:glycosyltransferase family 2 protein [Erwinia psidii]|uniref:Glycosyltransferase family 2 protein n=1 Tax=Erwinia psidii TaxID=69224 RepID=A0A3N6S7U2_9GAMM|nr:glycosyltransferase family 2 protein [Erwinia psidii]MCX8959154.1 glycosyltransferase family 2 protein [Erwinia psidii]MCX8962228.1 glycosyltransferase family 2 protein [Erwinia psidii]MCX8966866.1 glycosyltransferase family 2 protein [Erwinia psidii]RQM37210.1 glycosyltransferase family 2 protein [Erwinia psidii]
MTTPCLSILIAAHNCGDYLVGTLDSIVASLGGALTRTEIVIVNDASTDNTQAIIDDYMQRLPILHSFRTDYRNVGKVRNYAVRQARGEYILMVDGDDRLLPGALQNRLHTLLTHSPDILLSKIIEVRPGAPLPQWLPGEFTELSKNDAIERFLIHRDFQAHFIGQFFTRTLLQQHAFPDFICYEDTWLFPLLLTYSKKTLFTHHGFYLYRKHPHSLSAAIDQHKITCLIAATQNMDNVLPEQFEHLITCHWLDIANRYHSTLRGTAQGTLVKERIARISLLRFLLNRKIRMSFKRKMLAVRKLAL